MSILYEFPPQSISHEGESHRVANELIALLQRNKELNGNVTPIVYITEDYHLRWLSEVQPGYRALGTIKALREQAPQGDPFWYFVELIKKRFPELKEKQAS